MVRRSRTVILAQRAECAETYARATAALAAAALLEAKYAALDAALTRFEVQRAAA